MQNDNFIMAKNYSTYNEFNTNHSLIIGINHKEKFYTTIFDEDDYEKIKERHWRASEKRTGVYVCTGSKKAGGIIYLQWYVLDYKPIPGYVVDHINRNPLDNRKCNLRVVEISKNIQNSEVRIDNKSTRIRGIHKTRKDKYCCDVQIDGNRFYFPVNDDLNYSIYIRFLWEKYIIKQNIISQREDLMNIIKNLDKNYKNEIEIDFWNTIYRRSNDLRNEYTNNTIYASK